MGHLLSLRDELSGRIADDRESDIGPLRDQTMSIVNGYFREKLLALPSIAEYVEQLTKTAAA